MEKKVEVQKREEGTPIPEGVSCTETEDSYYIRVKRDKAKLTFKVPKTNFFEASITIDEFASFDPKNFHGVWGTNGRSSNK